MKTRLFESEDGMQTGLLYHCPGCGFPHQIHTKGPVAWSWNGDREKPVLSPSVRVQCDLSTGAHVCHSFVGCSGAAPGEIIFLSDSTHALAGQIVPLPEWPREMQSKT